MDPLTLLAGGGLVVVGGLVGRAIRPLSSRPPKPPLPECSCEHGYGQHEQAGGQCRAEVERTEYGTSFAVRGTYWVPCPCLSYDGPEPLPRVWTPGGMA